MRLSKIKVNNFKSLVDFEIDLTKFNCLIGLNGSGKSTFLQFVDFLSQLMKGNMQNWLKQRKWAKDSLVFYRDNQDDIIKFEIHFSFYSEIEKQINGSWTGNYRLQEMRCTHETIRIAQDEFASSIDNKQPKEYIVRNEEQEITKGKINFNFQGSIFSQLSDDSIPKVFYHFKKAIKTIQSFGLMAPQYLKQNVKGTFETVGYEGEHLASFVHELNDTKRVAISKKIKQVYPTFAFFQSSTLADSSKELTIGDVFHNGNLTYKTTARYVNDGLLRVLAFLSELETRHQILLFDEIENGINPELIGFLLKEFIDSNKQIVVTTHSPLILNYLDDETAIPGVHFFYKTPEGFTHTVPFLSIPAMREKLEVMGPGEAFIDTNLVELSRQLCETEKEA